MAALTGPWAFHADTTTIDASKEFPLGTKAWDINGNEYIYLQGVASTAANDCVTFDESHVTTRSTANAQGRVAVAMAAVVASSYGWYQIYGNATCAVAASFADNGSVYLTSTAATLDDADVAGDAVVGMVGRSAIASGTATMEMNYPWVGNIAID